MPRRPLLLFPRARMVEPPKGKGFPPNKYHYPDVGSQRRRLNTQFSRLKKYFDDERVRLTSNTLGLEPESVLVIETIGKVDEFNKAVQNAGLEFLAEWDVDGIDPDDEFYDEGKPDHELSGRVYLTMTNQQGLAQVLSLWKKWRDEETFPRGQTKWRDVFNHIKVIRRWDIRDRIFETGLLEIWQEVFQDENKENFFCHIELWYRTSDHERRKAENTVKQLVSQAGGTLIAPPAHIPEIHFHALKVELPRAAVQAVIQNIDNIGIELFGNSNVMFYRPTGQCAVTGVEESEAYVPVDKPLPSGSPVVAILDGMPLANHTYLDGRLLLDDPEELGELYRRGERRHGTAMASLVVHGELDAEEPALNKPVYFRPVLQPNAEDINLPRKEHIPENIFYEDLIERAVRRIFEGEGETPPQAPHVKIINLSVGDPSRPFFDLPSPWARLMDWLSWKYGVLFCISTGNYCDPLELGVTEAEFSSLDAEARVALTLRSLVEVQSSRRLLSPSESINSLTIGALHSDASNPQTIGHLVDIIPDTEMPSPINRVGHGFRRSVKPDILMPGGRQLYNAPMTQGRGFRCSQGALAPGQRVATDGNQAGERSRTSYTRGTSNATALATRAAAQIYDVIEELRQDANNTIEEDHIAVLIKSLLIHGASWGEAAEKIENILESIPLSESRKRKVARCLGYGVPNISKVLECTAQRATALGCGHIEDNQVHEYLFPLPPDLSGASDRRRLTVTLAWFSPINPAHRNLRRANLSFQPPKELLNLDRQEADWQQVKKGTVQHEICEGARVSDFQDGACLVIPIHCKKDAGNLDSPIPYGLAVTLEVAEGVGIPIYDQIRERIGLAVRV